MSYDISIGKMNRNYTSNVVKVWDDVLPALNLRDMNGVIGYDCAVQLEWAICKLSSNREYYTIMLGETGGWGDYGGALSVLVELYCNCKKFPAEYVRVNC
jgi:hypothetical protein